MDKNERQFKCLFELYIKHQEQFQTVFHIVTALGIGWLAAGCALISINSANNPKWIISFIFICAFVNISLEIVGIFHFFFKIENEKKQLISLFDSIYPNEKNELYQRFFSMPYAIVFLSIVLMVIECVVFILLAVKYI